MRITEKLSSLPISVESPDFLDQFQRSQQFRIPSDAVPIRLTVTRSDAESSECEVGILEGLGADYTPASLFVDSGSGIGRVTMTSM